MLMISIRLVLCMSRRNTGPACNGQGQWVLLRWPTKRQFLWCSWAVPKWIEAHLSQFFATFDIVIALIAHWDALISISGDFLWTTTTTQPITLPLVHMVCHNSVSSFNCTPRQHDQDKIKLITFAPLKFAWYIPQFSLSITSSSSLHGENFILLNISAMWRYNYVAGMGKILCPMNNFCCTASCLVSWYQEYTLDDTQNPLSA